ncbi:MAG TPA: TonB family protein, partial [Acidobacteriota bacterium]|nr:TonB family protein [Acidobacteriota bacterium]
TMTQRFGVPALVAATFHVVLLFGIRPPIPTGIGAIIADPPVKLSPMPVDLITPPKLDPEFTNEQVKPLEKPGPVKPITEDRSVALRPDLPATPFDPPTTRPPTVEKIVPQEWGDGSTGKRAIGGPDGAPIFSLDKLDAHPRTKVQVSPEYPFALRSAGIEGNATIEFDVDSTGRVVSARTLSGTHREFEEAAVRAVLKWRFEPGKRHGKPVPFRMVVPIGFTMTGA